MKTNKAIQTQNFKSLFYILCNYSQQQEQQEQEPFCHTDLSLL